MFRKILIANRGEIAARVIRTARRLGVRTVAIYSDADREALHVALADEAQAVGPPPAAESYLSHERVIAAAKAAGAEAIHPGYGFLAEDADFAEACAREGFVFIGPPAPAIRAMGLKDRAKAIMAEAGVPVLAGYAEADQSNEAFSVAARHLGYPLLIKAAAGGGGKGMRLVEDEPSLGKALEGARREAKGAFGNDRLILETYIERPRHIEVQVFADRHGNVVHLFERDCSIQRRYQKVVEEAPAPGMTAELRRQMGEAAVRAARAIGYEGAGTVEFIVDAARGLRADAFYFMEMNTRLQVEHPVTEEITGLDLVDWQLRAAAGEPLPLTQSEIVMTGHAVEVRLYAEDPAKRFLPSIGRLARLRLPHEDGHLRVETGVREGDEVTMFYDPMIAKLVSWDQDRPAALRRLHAALAATEIAGVRTNAAFLHGVMAHPAFMAGDVDTRFIDRHLKDLVPDEGRVSTDILALAALERLLARERALARARSRTGDPHSPWIAGDGWRLNQLSSDRLHFRDRGEEVTIEVAHEDGGFVLTLPGEDGLRRLRVAGSLEADGTLLAEIAGARRRAAVVEEGGVLTVMTEGAAHSLELANPWIAEEATEEASGPIRAPMSGKIVEVMVKSGDRARRGAPLLVLEAMKMEHLIVAEADARVADVTCGPGDQVAEGAVLIAFEEEAD